MLANYINMFVMAKMKALMSNSELPAVRRPVKRKSLEVTFALGLQGKPLTFTGLVGDRSATQKSCNWSGSEAIAPWSTSLQPWWLLVLVQSTPTHARDLDPTVSSKPGSYRSLDDQYCNSSWLQLTMKTQGLIEISCNSRSSAAGLANLKRLCMVL